ncbi:MAG: alpha/beta hydrolase [Myxococcales bacterium]|nr:alpha/beta hydrolase [Myxococcales bacterium]
MMVMITAMASQLHAVRTGSGPRIVLVHGSASDHTSWSIQLASRLRESFTLVAYDRRPAATTVAEHAPDLAELISEASDRPLVVGLSFGAVVVLELARRHPALCAGVVLIEPPMAASDDTAAAPATFFEEFDRIIAEQGGPAAGEFFLRTVLGDGVIDGMPRAFRDRATAKWQEIRADSVALIAYRPRYAELASLALPVLLVGGDRSAPYFRVTLDALQAVLPIARRETVIGAGHMLQAEAPRAFHELLARFTDEIGLTSRPG